MHQPGLLGPIRAPSEVLFWQTWEEFPSFPSGTPPSLSAMSAVIPGVHGCECDSGHHIPDTCSSASVCTLCWPTACWPTACWQERLWTFSRRMKDFLNKAGTFLRPVLLVSVLKWAAWCHQEENCASNMRHPLIQCLEGFCIYCSNNRANTKWGPCSKRSYSIICIHCVVLLESKPPPH